MPSGREPGEDDPTGLGPPLRRNAPDIRLDGPDRVVHTGPSVPPVFAMTFALLTTILDWMGVTVFAISGALVASRKQMDLVGFALLATVTGIGGGTLRDLLLGIGPVFWVQAPAYLLVCVATSVLVFLTAHLAASRYRILLWFDALGLALFAVTGAERALAAGTGSVVAVTMGVVTGTFGGIIRDVLGTESPVVLSREVYVTAALAGATTFVALSAAGAGRDWALGVGLAVGLLVRGMALARGWSLPRYQERPGRTADEIGRPT